MACILRELTKRTGEEQYRSNLVEWLHQDPAKRGQPRLGLGLILGDIYQDIKRGKVKVAA
jgi:hypothetical protein